MSDKEFISALKDMDNNTLMDNLEDLGGDGYYQELRSAIIAEIRKRLAVPEREKGEWIEDVDKWGDVVTTVNGYICSKCGVFNSDKDNFCPNCGADMRGGVKSFYDRMTEELGENWDVPADMKGGE